MTALHVPYAAIFTDISEVTLCTNTVNHFLNMFNVIHPPPFDSLFINSIEVDFLSAVVLSLYIHLYITVIACLRSSQGVPCARVTFIISFPMVPGIRVLFWQADVKRTCSRHLVSKQKKMLALRF